MMVIVPEELGGMLGGRKKKRKDAPVAPEPTKDYGFTKPGEKPGDASKAAETASSTLAPTGFFDEYLYWIVGGGVTLAGVGVLWYLKKKGKI